MKWQLQEPPHTVWHLDKESLFNAVQLFKRSGHTIVDYMEGKRKKFYHPIPYLPVILALLCLVMYYLKLIGMIYSMIAA